MEEIKVKLKDTTLEYAIRDWVKSAKKEGFTDKKIKAKFRKSNGKDVMKILKKILLEERIETNKDRLEKLKGGFKKMPKKKIPKEDFEKEFLDEEEDEFEEEEEEEEEVEDVQRSFAKEEVEEDLEETPKAKPRRPTKPKINPAYFFDHTPENIRLLDPIKKTIIVEGSSDMVVLLQMNAKILQLLQDKL